jgi:hypothetical protein
MNKVFIFDTKQKITNVSENKNNDLYDIKFQTISDAYSKETDYDEICDLLSQLFHES